jgi:hypothetical protein
MNIRKQWKGMICESIRFKACLDQKKKKKKSQTAKRKILGIKFLLKSLFNFSNSLEISVKFYWRMPIKMPNLKYPILFF